MSLPVEDMVAVGEAMAGTDLAPPRDAMLITPSPSAMARLQQLHAAAASLAEDAPEIIDHPEAGRGLEQALIEAMVDCLVNREGRASTRYAMSMEEWKPPHWKLPSAEQNRRTPEGLCAR